MTARPTNILFVVFDDLNDTLHGLGGHPQARTPHLDRLASRGVTFTHCQSNCPLCGPSRASLWSGLAPWTTGYYGYNQQPNHWRENPILKDSVTLFEHAVRGGHSVYATGKIHHNGHEDYSVFRNRDGSNGFGVKPSFGPFPWDGEEATRAWGRLHPDLPQAWQEPDSGVNWDSGFGPMVDLSSAFGGRGGWVLGGESFRMASDGDRDPMPDERSAAWASEVLSKSHDRPFLLAVGFNRPHTPLHVPKKYFDLFPLESLELTALKGGSTRISQVDHLSRSLVTSHDLGTGDYGFIKYRKIMEAGGEDLLRRWTQAYLAAVAFADEQVGRVLDALEAGPHGGDTLVVVTSDNGYHMGEKEQLFKNSVWEESTRVPLLVAGPGVRKGVRETQPVSLLDLYPTCCDYGSLPSSPNTEGNGRELDGRTLRPLLEGRGGWEGGDFALSVVASSKHLERNEPGRVHEQHFSLRTERHRYIRCRNGEEELYDHDGDPHEWENLAHGEGHRALLQSLRGKLFGKLNGGG